MAKKNPRFFFFSAPPVAGKPAPGKKPPESICKIRRLSQGSGAMKSNSRVLQFLGLFLIACGIAGYLSNPENAKTALMSGGFFGTVCIVLGFLQRVKLPLLFPFTVGFLCLLLAAFCWRSSASWLMVFGGQPEKLFAAILITGMLLATLTSLVLFWRFSRPT